MSEHEEYEEINETNYGELDPVLELEEQKKYRESMEEIIPETMKSLRCCKICGLIKDEHQFLKDGCENCIELFGKDESLFTAQFTGIMSLLRPDRSYLARCFGMKKDYHVGLYAVSCSEMLEDKYIRIARRNGIMPLIARSL